MLNVFYVPIRLLSDSQYNGGEKQVYPSLDEHNYWLAESSSFAWKHGAYLSSNCSSVITVHDHLNGHKTGFLCGGQH